MSLARKTTISPQQALFDRGQAWEEHWWGMPSYVMGDARPQYRITVNLYTLDDLRLLGERLGLRLTPRTDSLTFPPESIDKPSEWVYSDEA